MTNLLLLIGTLAMGGATVLFVLMRQMAPKESRYLFAITGTVTFVACIAYLTMASSFSVTSDHGQTVYVARFADWLITTPLAMLGLALIALPDWRTKWPLIAALLGADLAMIASGILAGFASDRPVTLAGVTISHPRYGWFVVGLGFMGIMLYILVAVLGQASRRDPQSARLFKRCSTFTVVVWAFYPIVWLLTPEGTGTVGTTAEVGLYLLVDIVAKVGYGYILLTNSLYVHRRRQVFDDIIKGRRTVRPVGRAALADQRRGGTGR